MGFKNAGALWLLGLIVLLLFARRQTPAARLHVATLHLWQSMAPSRPAAAFRSLRRDPIAICLQAAFLVATVGALAHPFVTPRPSPVAIVIDLSSSMNARHSGVSRLDQARAQIRALIDGLPRRTRVQLIGAHTNPALLGEFPAGAPAVRALLDSLRAWDTPDDMAGAMALARNDRPAGIHVFSDHQRPAAAGTDVVWSTVGERGPNVAITAISAPDPAVAGTDRAVVIGIRNYGPAPVRHRMSIDLDGASLVTVPLTIQPGALQTVPVLVGSRAGIVTARLDMQDDLPSDDIRRIALAPARPIRIRIQSASRHLRAALAALSATIIEDTPQRPGDSPPHIVVCDGCPRVPADESAVLFAPVPPSERGDLLRLLHTGVRHPIGELVPFADAIVAAAGSRGEAPGDTVLARAGGQPAILASTSAGRRVVELRFDLSRSPLALDPAFPVIIWNAVQWLADDGSADENVRAGEPLRWTGPAGTPRGVGPGGEPVATTVRGGRTVIADTRAAGVYRLRIDGAEHRLVVNPAVDGESDLASAPVAGPTPSASLPPRDSDHDVTAWFVFAALALLALESLVRRGAFRRLPVRHAVR